MKKFKLISLMPRYMKYLLLVCFLVLYPNYLNAEEYRINTAETSEELYGIHGIEYTYNGSAKVMGMLSDSVFVTNKTNGKYDTNNQTLYTKPYIYTFESKIKFFKTILGTPAVAGQYRYYYPNNSSDTALSESTYLFNNAKNEFFEVRNRYDGDIYEDVEQDPKNKSFFCMKNRTYSGFINVDVYEYNSSSPYISYGGIIADSTLGSYHAGKKLIVIDASKFILITNKSIRLYEFDSFSDGSYSSTTLISETSLPDVLNNIYERDITVNSVVALPDGTYSFVIDYNQNTMVIHIDNTTKIKNIIYLGNTYYSETTNLNGGVTSVSTKGSNFVQSCYKKGDTIIYFGGYNNSPAIYEINLLTGKFETSKVDIPFYKNNFQYGSVDIRYINKKIYVNLGFIQRAYSSYPILRSGLVVYEPVPPTVSIFTTTNQIGDNTPMNFTVNVSGEYSYLSVYDKSNNALLWSGAGHTPVSLNVDFEGDKSIYVQILDADKSVLNTSNAIAFNKRNLLNRAYLAASTKTGLQNFLVLDDVTRFFENNAFNQKLVSDIKAKASGTFLIYNDVSDVLTPLLKA